MSTLAYLEWRQLVNRVRTVLRSPARLIMWAIIVGWIGLAIAGRVFTGGSYQGLAGALPEPYASAILFAFIALFGIVAYGAASGIAGTFSSPADARFLCGSKLPERSVVIWLQLRRSATALLRMLFTVIVIALVYIRGGSYSGIGLTALGGTLLVTGAAIPILKLRALRGPRFAHALCAAIIALGLLPVAILISSLIEPGWLPWTKQILNLHAGEAVHQLLIGNPLAVGALYLAAFAMVTFSVLCGHDLYPELYAASLRMAAYRLRRRRPSAMFTTEVSYRKTDAGSSRLFEGFRGAWTIAWKEWIAFVRSGSLRQMFVLGLIACAIGGAIFGRIAHASNHPLEASLSLFASTANMLVIFVAFASSVGLAADLRKPMWWMGPDSLRMRLVAWTIATSWRMALCIGLGLVAWAIVLRVPGVALAGIPVAFVLVLFLRTTGLALYAINPYGFDQRGPMAMLRVLITYILAIPPIAAAIIAGTIGRSLEAGIVAVILTALAEAAILIAFSAARIAGRGMTFAQGEAA